MSYAIARAVGALLEAEHKRASAALKALPGVGTGPMGLTPDAVKFSPEYRTLKAAADAAWEAVRRHNGMMVKRYAREMRQERGR